MRTKVFAAVTCLALTFPLTGAAFAEAGSPQDEKPAVHANSGVLQHLGMALGIGLGFAAGMAALGQSRAIGAALESVARQPEASARHQTMMLIGVVFIETLVIFTWVLFFLWGNKIVR